MLNFNVLKIICSKSADEMRKTRRNWNTGIKNEMRICRENPCFHGVRTTDVEISEACLAWNFDTLI
jgi:hypothetical protein